MMMMMIHDDDDSWRCLLGKEKGCFRQTSEQNIQYAWTVKQSFLWKERLILTWQTLPTEKTALDIDLLSEKIICSVSEEYGCKIGCSPMYSQHRKTRVLWIFPWHSSHINFNFNKCFKVLKRGATKNKPNLRCVWKKVVGKHVKTYAPKWCESRKINVAGSPEFLRAPWKRNSNHPANQWCSSVVLLLFIRVEVVFKKCLKETTLCDSVLSLWSHWRVICPTNLSKSSSFLKWLAISWSWLQLMKYHEKMDGHHHFHSRTLGFSVPGRSKKLLRTVIRMQNHRHAILLCHSACMVGTADGPRNGGVELGVVLGSSPMLRGCVLIITPEPGPLQAA